MLIIKGLQRPKSCASCWFNRSDLYCDITKGTIDRDDFSCDKECPIMEEEDTLYDFDISKYLAYDKTRQKKDIIDSAEDTLSLWHDHPFAYVKGKWYFRLLSTLVWAVKDEIYNRVSF